MGIYRMGGKVASHSMTKHNAVIKRKQLQKKWGHEASYRVMKVPTKGELKHEYKRGYVIIARRK